MPFQSSSHPRSNDLLKLAERSLFEGAWDANTEEICSFITAIADELADLSKNRIDWEPWRPFPGPQTQLIRTPAFITGFGGAAGGGKTGGLLTLTNYHRRSLIVRQSYTRLKDVIRRSFLQYAPVARYNSQDKLWKNIPGGREIEFGYCAHDNDMEVYRGQEHDLKAFDEVSELKRKWVLFIIGWTRSSIPDQRCRVVFTFNPPVHPEQLWVKNFFAPWIDPNYERDTGREKALPGELRYFVVRGDDDNSYDVEIPNEEIKLYVEVGGKKYRVKDSAPLKIGGRIYYPRAEKIVFEGEPVPLEPLSRTFIPAFLADNPVLRESGYDRVFSTMPEVWRRVLLLGDFSINFIEDNPFQVIPSSWVDAAVKRWEQERPSFPALTASCSWGEPRQFLQPREPRQQTGSPRLHSLTRIACDPSRGGRDATVIGVRFERWIAPFHVIPGEELKDAHGQIPGRKVADAIAAITLESGGDTSTEIFIDSIGVGASPLDVLRLMGYSNAQSFDVRKAAVTPDGRPRTDSTGNITFKNLRSMSWWTMREALDPDNPDAIALPPDRILKEELIAVRYRTLPVKGDNPLTPQFEVEVEPKEEIEKRIGRSTNHADTLAMLMMQNWRGFTWDDLL